jgi:ubiquinone/menaquinone biosynthesis C-methylase UbiE
MSTPSNPKREHPSTYMVPDRSSEEELIRLHVQDQLVTASMGGVLAEQPDSVHFQRILDVGCGTGGWLIEVAKTNPDVRLLIGIDVSGHLLDFAREQAEVQKVSNRVEFHTMDALRQLEFPAHFFDLINQRFASPSYLRTWDWPKLLQEYRRVARPGGIIRITESDVGESNSPALKLLSDLFLKAAYQAGRTFHPDGSVADEIANLLHRHGFQNVQTHPYLLEYRTGTPQWQSFFEDMKHLFRTITPFLQKWTRVPNEYEEIYQQMLYEMQQPDFRAVWKLQTVWGSR